jgi:hypothetical protein
MNPIALDTFVGFKRGDADCIEVVRHAGRLLLGVSVIGELLAGFACGERERRNHAGKRLCPDAAWMHGQKAERNPGTTRAAANLHQRKQAR